MGMCAIVNEAICVQKEKKKLTHPIGDGKNKNKNKNKEQR